MDMIEGDNIPGNYQTQIDLNNGGWVLIGILIALLIFVFCIAIYINYKHTKKIKELREFNKTIMSEEEQELLSKYRNLNDTDKTIVKDTVNNLSKNHMDNKHTTE